MTLQTEDVVRRYARRICSRGSLGATASKICSTVLTSLFRYLLKIDTSKRRVVGLAERPTAVAGSRPSPRPALSQSGIGKRDFIEGVSLTPLPTVCLQRGR